MPDVYLQTVARLEPDVAMIDPGAFYASAAISLKRTADSVERLTAAFEQLAALIIAAKAEHDEASQ